MSNGFEAINFLIRNGSAIEAINQLEQYVEADKTCADAFFLLGKAYHKIGNIKEAIYNYGEAAELEPNSPAAEALKQLQEILDFYNTDLYNP